MRTVCLKAVIIFALLACAAAAAAAQDGPVSWSLELRRAGGTLKRGGSFEARVVVRVEEGWRLYALSQPNGGPNVLQFELPEGQPFRLAGRVTAPPPLVKSDSHFGRRTYYYAGTAVFALPVSVSRAAPPGRQKFRVRAIFQYCSDRECSPLRDVTLEGTVRIVRAALAPKRPRRAAAAIKLDKRAPLL